MEWVSQNIVLTIALVLSAAGIFAMAPKPLKIPRLAGLLLTLAGGLAFAVHFAPQQAIVTEDILFYVFATGALLGAVLMVTSHNPVYSALWFALATLSSCGLYLLQSAPFIAAATIIVYAGAIIVTFLFVIMLSQQSGLSIYDSRARHPLLAVVAGFILLGALLSTIETLQLKVTDSTLVADTEEVVTNPYSHPEADQPLGTLKGVGRALFSDYLYFVEVGGTLLMIASIGAIIMAPRKEQGTL
ncbi:NADH-quinone oxidoreductase subunit J family protein [Planctomicrobium sp. SH668]|uniref:NADH-quinone oxidoreductase subunit J family protein n=1 Tax=Planctomicrobium sp. SH668 TaxID=3448126 RepID=UPI003F5B65B0